MTTLKPSWYSVESRGALSDILNLLHPPYTLWHLSYVFIGIALAPHIYLDRSLAVLVAFFLGLGIGAHALDETMGNPLKTKLSKTKLYAIGSTALGCAILIGGYYALTVSLSLFAFMAAESFFAVAYNLEMFEKKFHNTLVFAISWGAIPFLLGYYVNSLGVSLPVLIMACSIALLTVVQKSLSTEARKLRRKLQPIRGLALASGEIMPMTSFELLRPVELCLKALTAAIFILAVALLALHLI